MPTPPQTDPAAAPCTLAAALAERLRACAAEQPHWVCGAFPGARAAVTALVGRAVPGGWGWRTWHLYPCAGGGVVVRTSSRWTP